MNAPARWMLLAALVALAATACGDDDASTPQTAESTAVAQPPETLPLGPGPDDFREPPPLDVTSGRELVTLRPHSYCWMAAQLSVCADGVPDPNPPVLASDEPLVLEWPIAGWSFQVTTAWEERQCGIASFNATVGAGEAIVTGPGVFDILGRGPGGDAGFRLAVESTIVPSPGAPLAVWEFAPPDAELDAGYHPAITVTGLDGPPLDVVTTFRAVAADGATLEVPAIAETDPGCWTGQLYAWPSDGGFVGLAELIDVGDPPFEMYFTLTLDDVAYETGPAVWPDDFEDGSYLGPTQIVTILD